MTDKKAADADSAIVLREYQALSSLNGYAEIFSVFAGEPVHVRLARKPGWNPLRNRSTLSVRSIELHNVVTGAIVPVPVPRDVRIKRQKPSSHQGEGAAYEARIAIATDGLEPGLYECRIRDSAGGQTKRLHFNVKPERGRHYDIVCILPSFTWQAYSSIGGCSFYSKSRGLVRTVSTQRPLSMGGDNSIDAAIPFLRAFREAGAEVACIDSRDLHLGLVPGGRAPVMALLTHDEYWSAPMRAEIDRYVRRGGVLMVAAGNVCWWRITVEGDNLTVDKTQGADLKRRGRDAKGHQWHQLGEPEERTFVSSFRFGGYASDRIPRKAALARYKSVDPQVFAQSGSLKIERPDHPLFDGVALDPGDRFGEDVPIVYREIDAVPIKPDLSVDRMFYDADDIAPEVIATGTVIRSGPFHRPIVQAGIVVEADVGRGHVLHMGSFGWSRGLVQNDARVKQVMQNAYRYCRLIAADRRRRLR
jgi:hypothetical protein